MVAPLGYAKTPDQDVTALKATVQAQTWQQTNPSGMDAGEVQFSNDFPDAAWWAQFKDAYLTHYIQQALQASHTLKQAQANIIQARALAREYRGEEFPQVSITPSFTRERLPFSSFGTSTSGSSSGTAISSGSTTPGSSTTSSSSSSSSDAIGSSGTTFSYYELPLTVSYEADVFLLNHDITKSHRQLAYAAEQNYRTTLITLCTDVATAYFNLLQADKLVETQEQIIALDALDVARQQNQYKAGLSAQDQVNQANETMESAQATLQSYKEKQATYASQLAILTGQLPEAMPHPAHADLDALVPMRMVHAGYPAGLIARRPDILSAEDTLASDKINVRVARKQFLPTFNLTGEAGAGSLDWSHLLDWQSRLWSLTAGMTQYVFTGGTRKATVNYAKAIYQGQLQSYEQTVLQALKEVEDSAASLKADTAAYDNDQAQVASMEARMSIENNRYQQGLLALPDLDATKVQHLQAWQSLAQSKVSALVDTLSLYKALGGGF